MTQPPPPDQLRVHTRGKLMCADGQDVDAYLQAWAKDQRIALDTPVSLVTRSHLVYLLECEARLLASQDERFALGA